MAWVRWSTQSYLRECNCVLHHILDGMYIYITTTSWMACISPLHPGCFVYNHILGVMHIATSWIFCISPPHPGSLVSLPLPGCYTCNHHILDAVYTTITSWMLFIILPPHPGCCVFYYILDAGEPWNWIASRGKFVRHFLTSVISNKAIVSVLLTCAMVVLPPPPPRRPLPWWSPPPDIWNHS